MDDLTRIPLDAIKVTGQLTKGYVLYDRAQSKLVISGEQDTTNAIPRTGATIGAPLYYAETVAVEDPNDLVNYGYLKYQMDVFLASWVDYLPLAGGTMEGNILLASTNDDPLAIISKGQVDTILDTTKFIHKSGGTMLEAFHLHSTDASDYEDFHAVPKFLVDAKIVEMQTTFDGYFATSYLPVSGGTMLGPLYSNAGDAVNDGHVLTKEFVVQYVKKILGSMDWSCSGDAGTAIGCGEEA